LNRKLLIRKLVYLSLMLPTILGLYLMGHPSTTKALGGQGSAGGLLARQRDRHRISQANLGEIDPTGEAMKLAAFGLRGPAATILWHQVHQQKMREDWTKASATARQITKLMPNFVEVWKFLGWDISYNVAVEFDDYRDRYYWIKKGIHYMEEGFRINENEPRLIQYIGWVIGNKLGTADERLEYRKLFIADDDFHGTRPREQRDNWLVAKEYHARALEILDREPERKATVTLLLFFSQSPMYQMDYAQALEEEGTFGEKARTAWLIAGREWRDFGRRPLPSSLGREHYLAEYEPLQQQRALALQRLEELTPGLREQIREEKRAALSSAERAAIDTPPEERTEDEMRIAVTVEENKLRVMHREVATRAPEPYREEAIKLAEQIDDYDARLFALSRDREVVNFEYWGKRADLESTKEAVEARRLVHLGLRAFDDGELQQARSLLDRGYAAWRKAFDLQGGRFHSLTRENEIADDIGETFRVYYRIMQLMGDEGDFPPEGFPLMDVAEDYRRMMISQGMAPPELQQ
jgi:hypothetical protein